jgi:sugar-specific transcriptional regulator TrmB
MMSVVWYGDKMTIMPLSEHLIRELMFFDLTRNEATVYLALLQLKQASARAIAKLSNLSRQEIYRVLPRLEKLGMVEVIISKPTKFLVIPPEEVLSELIRYQQENLTTQISKLREKKNALENELKKVEGKSAVLVQPEPIHFALISGHRLINEKIEVMLRNAKSEVLWMSPKLEIRRAVIYDRDKMLRKCAQRNIKIRILTEIDEKNVSEVNELSRFCEIRHALGVITLITIVDDKELIIGSAVHTGNSLFGSELRNKLWTNDSSHIKAMKDFFEKVWSDSIPAKLEIESIKSGRAVETVTVVRGRKKVKEKILELIAKTQSKLFVVAQLDSASVLTIAPQLDALKKRNISIRWATVVNEQNAEVVQDFAAKVKLHYLKRAPVSFLVTDSDCLLSSTPLLQIPHEIIWSSDHNLVNMFWKLAEEIWEQSLFDFPSFPSRVPPQQ